MESYIIFIKSPWFVRIHEKYLAKKLGYSNVSNNTNARRLQNEASTMYLANCTGFEREIYFWVFSYCSAVDILGNSQHIRETFLFVSILGRKATAQKQTVDISGKTQGDNKGLRKILQAKQHQRIFALWKNVTQLRWHQKELQKWCGTLTKSQFGNPHTVVQNEFQNLQNSNKMLEASDLQAWYCKMSGFQ